MSHGLLYRAQAEGRAYEVAMDEVQFLAFGNGKPNSIGTANLNSCSAVMIVSAYGAILAHIPPRPNHHSLDLEAGDRHARAKMEEVAEKYNANKQHFPAGGNSWVVCAVFRGAVALPDQQAIMEEGLNRLGLSHSLVTYVAGRKDHFAGKGTIFIDGRRRQPVVYIEDQEISQDAQWWPAETASQTSYGAGSSAYGAGPSAYDAGSSTYSSVPSSYSAVSAENSSQATSYAAPMTYSYASTSDSAGSASYRSEASNAGSSSQTSDTSEEPSYYVEDKKYYRYENGKHVLQSERPRNVWVFNEKGWSGTDGMKWRYWDGKNITYSK